MVHKDDAEALIRELIKQQPRYKIKELVENAQALELELMLELKKFTYVVERHKYIAKHINDVSGELKQEAQDVLNSDELLTAKLVLKEVFDRTREAWLLVPTSIRHARRDRKLKKRVLKCLNQHPKIQ